MRTCVVIDDDEVTRELTVLFAAEAGFEAVAASSGEEALHLLTGQGAPFAVLADRQMSGLAGPELAVALRACCGPHTLLLLISAAAVSPDEQQGYDGFLRKPFSVEQLQAALDRRPALSADTFGCLSEAMPRGQLLELYAMCLDDADRRIERMRGMLATGDHEGYRRTAHAIRGGCGMVGALELTDLAAAMEEDGPDPVGSDGALDEFIAASQRLRRILVASTE